MDAFDLPFYGTRKKKKREDSKVMSESAQKSGRSVLLSSSLECQLHSWEMW